MWFSYLGPSIVISLCCSVAQVVSDSTTPWTAARQVSLSLTISRSLPKFMSIVSVMPSSHLILWCPLLLCPQSFPASETFPMSQLFTSEDQNIGASASASVLPTSIQGWFHLRSPGLISFRTDWLDLLAVQGTLKSLLQHHSSKASILQHSAFFIVQLSHPYMTTGKTIALTRRTFVGKVMSLLFNMLSRLGFIICGLMIKMVDSYMRIQWDHVKCQAHSRCGSEMLIPPPFTSNTVLARIYFYL